MPSKSKDSGFIDLGKTYDGPSCCEPMSKTERKPSYPTLYICTDKKIDIGEMGECAITYKRRQIGERTKEDGTTEYTYELDVQGLKPLESEDAGEEGEDMSSEPKSSKGFRSAMESSMSQKGVKY